MRKEFRTSKELMKRFSLSIVLAIFAGIFLFSFSFYSIFSGSSPVREIPFLLFGTLFLIWAWLTTSIVKSTRLVLTEKQIEFYSPGLQVVTSWDNLERIDKSANYDSLILRTPAVQKMAWWFRLVRKKPERQIPLSLFLNWRSSEIGKEIKKYAAHLFPDNRTSR